MYNKGRDEKPIGVTGSNSDKRIEQADFRMVQLWRLKIEIFTLIMKLITNNYDISILDTQQHDMLHEVQNNTSVPTKWSNLLTNQSSYNALNSPDTHFRVNTDWFLS